jgi:hypothetical protein
MLFRRRHTRFLCSGEELLWVEAWYLLDKQRHSLRRSY